MLLGVNPTTTRRPFRETNYLRVSWFYKEPNELALPARFERATD